MCSRTYKSPNFRQPLNAASSPGGQMSSTLRTLEEEGSKSELLDLTDSSYRGGYFLLPKMNRIRHGMSHRPTFLLHFTTLRCFSAAQWVEEKFASLSWRRRSSPSRSPFFFFFPFFLGNKLHPCSARRGQDPLGCEWVQLKSRRGDEESEVACESERCGSEAEVMKMTGAMETSFKLALKKPPSLRTAEVNKTNVLFFSFLFFN